MVSERIKWLQDHGRSCNQYFWRTHQQQEIDYIEEEGGKLEGFEFKTQAQRYKPPKAFLDHYHGSTVTLIHRENFMEEFLGNER